mmetsp:Transcript_16100/g.35325  ORF Transcript_16100/g.35325 Transcript_16100/m.35325 type:complete len:437 (+) Transcript_16100:62-1372(+)
MPNMLCLTKSPILARSQSCPTLDWPLSREEKKRRVLDLYARDIMTAELELKAAQQQLGDSASSSQSGGDDGDEPSCDQTVHRDPNIEWCSGDGSCRDSRDCSAKLPQPCSQQLELNAAAVPPMEENKFEGSLADMKRGQAEPLPMLHPDMRRTYADSDLPILLRRQRRKSLGDRPGCLQQTKTTRRTKAPRPDRLPWADSSSSSSSSEPPIEREVDGSLESTHAAGLPKLLPRGVKAEINHPSAASKPADKEGVSSCKSHSSRTSQSVSSGSTSPRQVGSASVAVEHLRLAFSAALDAIMSAASSEARHSNHRRHRHRHGQQHRRDAVTRPEWEPAEEPDCGAHTSRRARSACLDERSSTNRAPSALRGSSARSLSRSKESLKVSFADLSPTTSSSKQPPFLAAGGTCQQDQAHVRQRANERRARLRGRLHGYTQS